MNHRCVNWEMRELNLQERKIVFDGRIVIDRPLREVFVFTSDYRNDRLWREETVDVRYITPEPIGPGSQCLEIARIWGSKLETWSEVSRFVQDDVMISESYKAQLPLIMTRQVLELAEGTQFYYRVELDVCRAMWLRRLKPLYQRSRQRAFIRNLTKLKQLLEQNSSKGWDDR